MNKLIQEKLLLIPEKPGCYLMKDINNIIIYVGKAKNLKRRVNSYFKKTNTGKTKVLVDHIVDFEYIITNSETESLILELNLIKKHSPKYNILLKDDKTYPYIELTNEKYPKLRIVRKKRREKTKSKLFGPYPNVISARNTVELINRLYPLRKCNKLHSNLCLYYHIGECLGYCKFAVEEKTISNIVKEITNILNGDYKFITKKLEEEMKIASDALNYEKANEIKTYINDIKDTINKQIIVSNIKYNFDVFATHEKDNFIDITTLFIRDGVIVGKVNKIFNRVVDDEDIYSRYIAYFYEKYPLPKEIIVSKEFDADIIKNYLNINVITPEKGDIKKILNMATLNASINLDEKIELLKKNDDLRKNVNNDLKNMLNLEKLERIELFDNSHLFGTYYVGVMVVYNDLSPDKKEYRKYKISVDNKDDLSAMKEVIYRRYFKALVEKTLFADLIIVDGGELQVRAVKDVLDSLKINIKVIGLKKDDKHHTNAIIDDNYQTLNVNNNNLFLYLTRMQDEVHRFAISYHRDIKSKGSIASILTNVKGIGERRKQELLKKYGSIKKIKDATEEELETILPHDIAVELKKYLETI